MMRTQNKSRPFADRKTAFFYLLENQQPLLVNHQKFLNDDRKLVGILSKSDFLKDLGRQLILVDHNELSQAVRGGMTGSA